MGGELGPMRSSQPLWLTSFDLNIEEDNFMKFVSFQSPNTWSDINLVLFMYIDFKHFQMFLITYVIR